jgi:hypothetical protein
MMNNSSVQIVLSRGEVVQVDFVEVLRVVLIMCDHVWLSCRGGQVENTAWCFISVRQLRATLSVISARIDFYDLPVCESDYF